MARRAHLFGIGETKRRRRRRRSRGFLDGGNKGWSGMDTVMTIGALGAIGFVGYFVLKSGKGVEEGLQTGGEWLKNLTDAINSTGQWFGQLSYDFQEGGKNVYEWFSKQGEGLGNAGCWAQKLFNPSLQCTDLNKRDTYILARIIAGGSPKPATKITNNVYHTMMRLGVNPDLI